VTYVIVLFNLKSGAGRTAYEDWARNTDLPAVRSLESCSGFDVLRTTLLLGSDEQPPYEYVEIIRLSDMSRFREEVASEAMRRVAGEFRQFADAPVFMVSESLEA